MTGSGVEKFPMVISLSIIYYAHLIAVAIFILYGLFNVYHLLKFGFLSAVNVLIVLAYIIVAGGLLSASFSYLLPIDWQQPLIDLGQYQNQPF